MITRLEALDFRCLRHVSQNMGPFHVLIGPNASGKTTFLDVVAFLGDLVAEDLETAVSRRTQNFEDLLWRRRGERFELAIEMEIPEPLRGNLREPDSTRVRYEVALGMIDPETAEFGFLAERARLLPPTSPTKARQRRLFPEAFMPPESIQLPTGRSGFGSLVLNKVPEGNDNFYSETYSEKGKGWVPAFKLGPKRSALANLPEDESKFPVATWLKGMLTSGIQQLVLNSLLIRRASPPGRGRHLLPDGSNLPWVVANLERRHPDRLRRWVSHLRTALPDLSSIRTIERPDDKHRYLMLEYSGELEVPSWMASDGTLRLLALTLPAYLPDFSGIYLVEEPENGIHPRAVETMFQSLSSIYGAQMLLATHSPVVLGIADLRQLICFAKTKEGATDVVSGHEHPALRDWRQETNLSTLFAAGVLG